jgi:hypothetical protein
MLLSTLTYYLLILCFNLQDKEKAALDFKNCISPDNKSTSSFKGPSFMQSNQKKLAKKRASSNNEVAANLNIGTYSCR